MGNCLATALDEGYRKPASTGLLPFPAPSPAPITKSGPNVAAPRKPPGYYCPVQIVVMYPRTPVTATAIETLPVWDGTLSNFTQDDLRVSTGGWDAANVLGEGGFGQVFKGMMLTREGEKIVVAIKRLTEEGMQGFGEWLAEVTFLGRLQHPNLVRLLGHSHGYTKENSLVYEYVSLRSLDTHLFSKDPSIHRRLTWYKRVKIALGAARGLVCLHATGNDIIHRDFKAANILLDANYEAKLADFGLAKDLAGGTHVTTGVMGTLGYLDPSNAQTGRLTKKSDVYAYGVVLLELLTGKKAVGINEQHQLLNLTAWAKPYIESRRMEELEVILDDRLEEKCPRQVARVLAISARHCVQLDNELRPDMAVIVESLTPLLQMIESQQAQNGHVREVPGEE